MLSNNTGSHNGAPLHVALVADRDRVPRVITVNPPTGNERTSQSSRGQTASAAAAAAAAAAIASAIPSVVEPTPKVRNGTAGRGDNRSLSSSSSATNSATSRPQNFSASASDGASSTSFSVPPPRQGVQNKKTLAAVAHVEAELDPIRATKGASGNNKTKGIDNSAAVRPPRPMPTQQQRQQRQQMLSQSIAFQHGEDATTLCSSVADDSRNDQSSLGGSHFSGASERDSMTNSVGFSYDEEDDGHDDDGMDDGYDGLCLFGIDGPQVDDDFEKFYDDLSIDSQGRDGLDRERAARYKEKMKQMASALKRKTGGKKKEGRGNRNQMFGPDGGSLATVAQDICSPDAARARLEMAYESYLHTYKFDTVKTPTVSKSHNNADGTVEARRIDRRTKRGKYGSKRVISDDVAVATMTVPPFQGSATMDSNSTESSNGSTDHTCPMCSSKLLNQHRRVDLVLDPAPTAVPNDVATARMITARAANPRDHDCASVQKYFHSTTDNCLQCADKCPDAVQPTVKGFLHRIFAFSSTEHNDAGVQRKSEVETAQLITVSDHEEKPVPPYCTECRAYIVMEATELEMREEMLLNLSEWMVDINDDDGVEDDEENEFQIASLKLLEETNVVVDRPLRGNILVILDEDDEDGEGGQLTHSLQQDTDEQSVTTRQQENLSAPPAPMVSTYPGLNLVSSGEVEARGREVLPPPPNLPSTISEEHVDSHVENTNPNVRPMFASQFGPPDATTPISDALNDNAARPNSMKDTDNDDIGVHLPGVMGVSSLDQAPSIRTEDEEAEMIASYPTKRDIATKIIGAKLLNGFSLTHKQCSICDMPMMEKDRRCKCVVCPVIKRKAKRHAREKRKERKETGCVRPGKNFARVETGPTVCNTLSPDESTENAMATITNSTHIPQGNEEAGQETHDVDGDNHRSSLKRKSVPTDANISKVIGGNALLELIEAPVLTYFDEINTVSDRLLNGWHLSSEHQGCPTCGHPVICREMTDKCEAKCINNNCQVTVTTGGSESQSQAPVIQSNASNRSYDSNDDDTFDLDDPALVALQKLACDKKKNDTKETRRKASARNVDNTLDVALQKIRAFGDDTSTALSQQNQRRDSLEYFTFDRQGLDCDLTEEDSIDPTSRTGPEAEIHCGDLSSCSSLSFTGRKSHCSKKTCTTGIATSRSDSSDGSDDMSALVEKMNRAKKRILSRVEKRSAGLKNKGKSQLGGTSRNDVEYDVANLIDRLASAAKEVEELDQALDF